MCKAIDLKFGIRMHRDIFSKIHKEKSRKGTWPSHVTVIIGLLRHTVKHNLHAKTRYVCLFVCMLPMAGRTAGPIKTKLGIGTRVDPRSVLVKVKVKVIYLCVRYNRIHDSDTWRTTVKHARSSSSSSSSAVAGATW